MKKFIFGFICLMFTSQIFASCTQSDSAGTWAAFAATNSQYFSGAGKGTLVISSLGTVDKSKSSMVIVYDYSTSPTATLQGNVKIDSFCGVSGSISTPNTTYTIYGQLNSNKNTVLGVYRSSAGDTGTLNFVKK